MNVDIDTLQFAWTARARSLTRAGRIAERSVELVQRMLRERLPGTADYRMDNLSVPPVQVDENMSDEQIAQRTALAIVRALMARGER